MTIDNDGKGNERRNRGSTIGTWIRTTSPEQSIHLCKTSFYPHRLRLLGPSHNFGLTHRVSRVGRSRWATSPTTQTLHSVSTRSAPATTSTFHQRLAPVAASGPGDHPVT